MSIQAAGGTYVNAVSSTLAARSDMQAFVRDNLITAGWTVVSGGGTGDTLLQSADTPAGFHCQLRCLDPGSGNCAQFTMRNVSGIRISNIAYMLPTSGKQFRIIANKYQFFVYATGGTEANVAREIMMGGVPYLPSWIASLTSNLDCFWFVFTGDTDTTTTARLFHFRYQTYSVSGSDYPAAATLFNDILVNYASNNSTALPTLEVPTFSGSNTIFPLVWNDGSLSIYDAILAWSGTSSSTGTMSKFGQLWDAFVIDDVGVLTPEATVAVGGNNYILITRVSTTTGRPSGRVGVRIP